MGADMDQIAVNTQRLCEMMDRMIRSWSPALRDRIIRIHIDAMHCGRNLNGEELSAELGFDPTNVAELQPPWRAQGV
jgi:hypothetical protein